VWACFGWWLGEWAEKEVSVSVHLVKKCRYVGGLGVVQLVVLFECGACVGK